MAFLPYLFGFVALVLGVAYFGWLVSVDPPERIPRPSK